MIGRWRPLVTHITGETQKNYPTLDDDVSTLKQDWDELVDARRQRLSTRRWFRAVDSELQQRLLQLPGPMHLDDCSGLIDHLMSMPEEGGDVRVLSLREISIDPDRTDNRRIFGLQLVFDVLNITTGEQYCYECFVPRQGQHSGSKLVLVILNEEGLATHVALRRQFSFACGKFVIDGFGGFAESGDADAAATALREFREESGVELNETNLRVVPLGSTVPDPGIMPSEVHLFAAFASMTSKQLAQLGSHVNSDPTEFTGRVFVVPVEKLGDVLAHPRLSGMIGTALCHLFAAQVIRVQMPRSYLSYEAGGWSVQARLTQKWIEANQLSV